MPKLKRRSTSREEWSEENMKRAVQEVLERKSSLRVAADRYQVPRSSLQVRVKALKQGHQIILKQKLGHFQQTFIPEFERQLCEHVIDLDRLMPLTRKNKEHALNALQDGNVTTILCENCNDKELMTRNAEITEIDEIIEIDEMFPTKRKVNWDTAGMQASKLMKEKGTIHTFVSEDDIEIERIKHIMEQEKEMADIRKVHEKNVIRMKEEFYTKLHALKIREALAKTELAELQLRKEIKNMKMHRSECS